jgi:uncharacterized membrane protein HdeD (DUF308 family)
MLRRKVSAIPVISERQDRLLRMMRVLVWLALGILVAATVLYLAGEVVVTYVLAIVLLLTIVAELLVGRALQRTGPPLEAVRWHWPWASRR